MVNNCYFVCSFRYVCSRSEVVDSQDRQKFHEWNWMDEKNPKWKKKIRKYILIYNKKCNYSQAFYCNLKGWCCFLYHKFSMVFHSCHSVFFSLWSMECKSYISTTRKSTFLHCRMQLISWKEFILCSLLF